MRCRGDRMLQSSGGSGGSSGVGAAAGRGANWHGGGPRRAPLSPAGCGGTGRPAGLPTRIGRLGPKRSKKFGLKEKGKTQTVL